MMDEELVAKIKQHYQLGQGSIQDIARVYRLTVDEVLRIIGQEEMLEVESIGDLIDEDEAGPNATINRSKIHRATYTTN